MDKPQTQSQGKDLFSAKIGHTNEAGGLKFNISGKLALNEDKGIVMTGAKEVVVVDRIGLGREVKIYQGDDGNIVTETSSSIVEKEPSFIPSSPIQVDPDAIFRTITGTVEFLENYIKQRLHEIRYPQEKYEKF